MSTNLRNGELAQQAGCLVETVRYYDREGLLLEPARSKENYRLYANVHVERLQFIRHCRSLDMTLEEIRNLLSFRDAPEANCGEVNALLDEHIEHVRNRLKELRFLEKNLRELRSLCAKTQATRDCGILQSLGTATTRSLRPSKVEHRNSHLHKTHFAFPIG